MAWFLAIGRLFRMGKIFNCGGAFFTIGGATLTTTSFSIFFTTGFSAFLGATGFLGATAFLGATFFATTFLATTFFATGFFAFATTFFELAFLFLAIVVSVFDKRCAKLCAQPRKQKNI